MMRNGENGDHLGPAPPLSALRPDAGCIHSVGGRKLNGALNATGVGSNGCWLALIVLETSSDEGTWASGRDRGRPRTRTHPRTLSHTAYARRCTLARGVASCARRFPSIAFHRDQPLNEALQEVVLPHAKRRPVSFSAVQRPSVLPSCSPELARTQGDRLPCARESVQGSQVANEWPNVASRKP